MAFKELDGRVVFPLLVLMAGRMRGLSSDDSNRTTEKLPVTLVGRGVCWHSTVCLRSKSLVMPSSHAKHMLSLGFKFICLMVVNSAVLQRSHVPVACVLHRSDNVIISAKSLAVCRHSRGVLPMIAPRIQQH